MTPSGPVNFSNNQRRSLANAVSDMFFHQCCGTLYCFGGGCIAAANALVLLFLPRLAPDQECTSDLCLKFSAINCGWAVRLNLKGLTCVFDCAIVLLISLLTLLVLQLLASKISYACYRVTQRFFLPSPLYLRSPGGSSSPSIHTPSYLHSSPSSMVSLLLSCSSNITRLLFHSITTFSPRGREIHSGLFGIVIPFFLLRVL